MALSLPSPLRLTSPDDLHNMLWDTTPILIRQKTRLSDDDILLVHDEPGMMINGWPVVFKVRGNVDPKYLTCDPMLSDYSCYCFYLGYSENVDECETLRRFVGGLSFPYHGSRKPGLQGFIVDNDDNGIERLCFSLPVTVCCRYFLLALSNSDNTSLGLGRISKPSFLLRKRRGNHLSEEHQREALKC